jgi:hypothetical protein
MPFAPVADYCEENVWQMAQQVTPNPRWAVFISTEDRKCFMHAQISHYKDDALVCWDYHVVLLEQSRDGFTIWDPNCTLGYPLSATEWTRANFPDWDCQVRFRLVESQTFLRDFRSDRRHMRNAAGELEAPPPWPEISPGESNLDSYTSTSPSPPGAVMALGEWLEKTTQARQEALATPN